jgi:hypothetical protein
MTSGAKDVYIKVKDADGNVSAALKISVPAYSPPAQPAAPPDTPDTPPDTSTEADAPPDAPPDFSGIVITGGTVVYLNPAFSGITITFGNP